MVPITFNRKRLANLPAPSEAGKQTVPGILDGILAQRTIPYFRQRDEAYAAELLRLRRGISIHRLEDPHDDIPLVSLLTCSDGDSWSMEIHERLFDHMASVTPLHAWLPQSHEETEEKRTRAFAELVLRHNIDHILHPHHSQEELILSDVEFASDWRKSDPVSYRLLKDALMDGRSGIDGTDYLELLERSERGESLESTVERIVHTWEAALEQASTSLPEGFFTSLNGADKSRVLNGCFKESLNPNRTIIERASHFEKYLDLFRTMLGENLEDAVHAFNSTRERWSAQPVFEELGVVESALNGLDDRALFDLFVRAAQERVAPHKATAHAEAPPPAPKPANRTAKPANPKAIKELIEEAEANPTFPPQALDLIYKNRQNASGQSGAKYTELIETLLAIPWGRVRHISVSPEAFEAGLHQSHHGLAKPKEILCDFFSNLIWRYENIGEEGLMDLHRTGSAILLVGPPGVGKTSLAISVAENLGIPYHKISLGGMKDEADIRGYGFTYEGSKPGPIVQGLVKMGVMNGMFILDEVDKTEPHAVSTLLEILDPEQNHLFHDKYTQSTVDIDLSNAHFILTANNLGTVPSPVLDRCELVVLDRYGIEEKINIAREHLLRRIRQKFMIGEGDIFFDPEEESAILRHLIRRYTQEAGVRDLERLIRTLFLRIHRKEILTGKSRFVRITLESLDRYLDKPAQARLINEDDRVGEAMGLGVNAELGVGSLIPIQTTSVMPAGSRETGGFVSMVYTTGNIEKIMDESRKVALTAIMHRARELGISRERLNVPVHLHFMAASTKKDGPSAGGAIALALASHYLDRKLRRDVAMTGEIDTQGRINGVGGLGVKIETACAAGVKTLIIPKENLYGPEGVEMLSEPLRRELQILGYKEWKGFHEPLDPERHVLQVVAVDDILQAIDVAMVHEERSKAALRASALHSASDCPNVAARATLRRESAPSLKPIGDAHHESGFYRIGKHGLRHGGKPTQGRTRGNRL
ncbi:MAG: S16 family serine protease [Acidobacteriota bacterium]